MLFARQDGGGGRTVLGSPDLDAFIRERQWAVMTTLRGSGQPASSVVGYAIEGDELLVAADETSLKVRCLKSDARLTLCVFSDDPQPRFATIEGRGAVQRQGIDEAKKRVLSDTVPRGHAASQIETWLERPATLILRVQAARVWGELSPSA